MHVPTKKGFPHMVGTGLECTFIWERMHFVRGSYILGGVACVSCFHAGCVEPLPLSGGTSACLPSMAVLSSYLFLKGSCFALIGCVELLPLS